MNTIKNLQNEVIKYKSQSNNSNGLQRSSAVSNFTGIKAIQSQKLKRKYDFLMKENQRLKTMNETMKTYSREDFSKVVEMNVHYKMLNNELKNYVTSLKDDLGE